MRAAQTCATCLAGRAPTWRKWRRSGCRSRPASPSPPDRKSTRLNSSHPSISYAVFCLKKKKNKAKSVDRKKKTKQNKQTMRDQHVEKIEEEAHVNGLVHLRHITGRVIMSNASIVAALR